MISSRVVKNGKVSRFACRIITIALIALASCATFSNNKPQLPETTDPVRWCSEVNELLIKLLPSRMWKFGEINKDVSTLALDDISAKAAKERAEILTKLTERFATLDVAGVEDYLRPGVIAFGEMLRGMVAWEARGFDAERRLIFYLAWPRIFLDVQFLQKADIASWVRLAPDTARWLSQIGDRLREPGAAILSSAVRNRAIEVCERYTVTGTDNPFYKGYSEAGERSTLPEAEKARLDASMLDIINQKIVPAYSKLLKVLRALPVSDIQEEARVLSIDDYFASPLSRASGFMGLLEYSRVIDTVLAEYKMQFETAAMSIGLDTSGTLQDIDKRIREKIIGTLTIVQDSFEAAFQFVEKAPELLLPYFHTLPFEHITFEDSTNGAYAEYLKSVVKIPHKPVNPYLVYLTVSHEYMPGHFLFFSVAGNAPPYDFITHFWYESGIEGWATYAEGLALEAGVCDYSPLMDGVQLLEKYYKLIFDQFNIRFLVDDFSWDDPRYVIDTIITKSFPEKTEAVSIFYGFGFDHPIGYGLSYLRGYLAIAWCRARAEAALGKDFDIKNFHDYILKNQAISQAIVAGIDKWIESQRKK